MPKTTPKLTQRQWDWVWLACCNQIYKDAQDMVEVKEQAGISESFIACVDDMRDSLIRFKAFQDFINEVEPEPDKEDE